LNTGGGAFVEGNVSNAGDFVGRDQVVHNNEVYEGDITVGDIVNASDVVIGNRNQIIHQEFAPLYRELENLRPDQKEEAEQIVKNIEKEVVSGKQGDDQRLSRLIDRLVDLIPGAVSAVVSMFSTPVLSGLVGPATKAILDQIRGR
jgi:hypothetical protein